MHNEKIIEKVLYTTEQTVFTGVNHTQAKFDILKADASEYRKCSVAFPERKYSYRFGLHDIFTLEKECRHLLSTDPLLAIFAEKWRYHGQKDIFAHLKNVTSQWKRLSIDYVAQQTGIRRTDVAGLVRGADIEIFLGSSGLYLVEVIPILAGCDPDQFLGSTMKGTAFVPSIFFQRGGGAASQKMQEISQFAQLAFLQRMEEILVTRGTPVTIDALCSKELEEEVAREWESGGELWQMDSPKYMTIFLGTFALSLTSSVGTALHSMKDEVKN